MMNEETIARAQNLLARIALGDFTAFVVVAVAGDGSSEEVYSSPAGETFKLMGALHSTSIDLHNNLVYRDDRGEEPPQITS